MVTPYDHMKGAKPVTSWAAHRSVVASEVKRLGLPFTADAEDLARLHYRHSVGPEASGEMVANGLRVGNIAALKDAYPPPAKAMEESAEELELIRVIRDRYVIKG